MINGLKLWKKFPKVLFGESNKKVSAHAKHTEMCFLGIFTAQRCDWIKRYFLVEMWKHWWIWLSYVRCLAFLNNHSLSVTVPSPGIYRGFMFLASHLPHPKCCPLTWYTQCWHFLSTNFYWFYHFFPFYVLYLRRFLKM